MQNSIGKLFVQVVNKLAIMTSNASAFRRWEGEEGGRDFGGWKRRVSEGSGGVWVVGVWRGKREGMGLRGGGVEGEGGVWIGVGAYA